jgi:acetyl-CoA carboxylase biotin carboxyl carrier protein
MSHDDQPGDVSGEPAEEAPVTDTADLVEPVAVGPGEPNGPSAHAHHDADGPAAGPGEHAPATPADAADASLLALVDKLTSILERSDLGELEVASGGTTVILRSPSAIERQVAVTAAPTLEVGVTHEDATFGPLAAAPAAPPPVSTATAAAKPSVKAPLTGIFYGAPSPGAMPYVQVGDHVSVGQIIGLIEAMKLFNEIKSDLAGKVVRICSENGALVKAKQPLIEVEPA